MPAPSPPELSPQVLQQLRQHIDAALVEPAAMAEAAAAHRAAPGMPADFCSFWPGAKPVLQTVAGLIVFIPGPGTSAAAALNALIVVGDQIYRGTCHR
jgi:hypothetical protein